MKCEFCSHDNEPGVKFCGKCGAQMPEKPKDDANKLEITDAVSSVTNMVKAMPLKRILKFVVPVALAIIVLIIAVPMLRGPNFSIVKDSINFFADADTVVVSGNNNAKFTIDGELQSSQKNLDGSKAVVLTDYDYSSGGTLWYVTTTNCVRIADDVLAYQISDSGKGVVYFTDYDSENAVAALYLYDAASQKTARITDEAMYQGSGSIVGVCISPNGKTVAYVSDYDSSNHELTGYIKADGKSAEKLGDNMAALAISDAGKHIYYAKMTNDGASASLNVRRGQNDNRLMADMSLYGVSLILNKDYSQVIFNMEDKSYISQNGAERAKISNSAIHALVSPRGAQTAYTYGEMGGVTVYNVNSFANVLAMSNDGVVYIDNKYETSKISGGTSYSSTISNDGKTLLYITSSDNLSVIDPTKSDAKRKELAENVKTFVSSNDGKTIYYVNDDDELWCIKGTGKPTKISDDVSSDYLALAYNSNKIFFLVDYSSRTGGQLYYSDNGGKRTKVPGDDDIVRVWSTPANVFFLTIDSSLYRSDGNEKFVLFQDDANIGY